MTSKILNYISRYSAKSEEEQACYDIIYNSKEIIQFGDKKLNNIAALTYNFQTCGRIFYVLEKALEPEESSWKTLLHTLLLLRTIVLYGSEAAVDQSINMSRFIRTLQNYNSAVISGGGVDYGAPVRKEAKTLDAILRSDTSIRNARANARKEEGTLVPLGSATVKEEEPSDEMSFGQGITKPVGAGYGLEKIPGMYEGRPERYFDNSGDTRKHPFSTGSSTMNTDDNVDNDDNYEEDEDEEQGKNTPNAAPIVDLLDFSHFHDDIAAGTTTNTTSSAPINQQQVPIVVHQNTTVDIFANMTMTPINNNVHPIQLQQQAPTTPIPVVQQPQTDVSVFTPPAPISPEQIGMYRSPSQMHYPMTSTTTATTGVYSNQQPPQLQPQPFQHQMIYGAMPLQSQQQVPGAPMYGGGMPQYSYQTGGPLQQQQQQQQGLYLQQQPFGYYNTPVGNPQQQYGMVPGGVPLGAGGVAPQYSLSPSPEGNVSVVPPSQITAAVATTTVSPTPTSSQQQQPQLPQPPLQPQQPQQQQVDISSAFADLVVSHDERLKQPIIASMTIPGSPIGSQAPHSVPPIQNSNAYQPQQQQYQQPPPVVTPIPPIVSGDIDLSSLPPPPPPPPLPPSYDHFPVNITSTTSNDHDNSGWNNSSTGSGYIGTPRVDDNIQMPPPPIPPPPPEY